MSLVELASKHGLSVGLVRVKAAQLGLPNEGLSAEDEETLLTEIKGVDSKSNALPEAEETPSEKPKRGRKKSSQLAKKAASDLEQNASGAAQTGSSFVETAAMLKAQEMMSNADIVAATGYAAFTGRLAQNDAAFLSWFANGTNQAIANNANAANPEQILAKLGIPSTQESLGKFEISSFNLDAVEDVAASLRFYDESAA